MTESTLPARPPPARSSARIAPGDLGAPRRPRPRLQSLRSVPGFDEVVKQIYGFIGEAGRAADFSGGTRCGSGRPSSPRLNQLLRRPYSRPWIGRKRPELFVSQNAVSRTAGAFRHGPGPFIVINSGTLRAASTTTRWRNVLGHELGHVMSGHALYHTILRASSSNVSHGRASPFPRRASPSLPIQLAPARVVPKERALIRTRARGCWRVRNPTASAAREPQVRRRPATCRKMDLNAFLVQAKEFEETGGAPRIASSKILGVLGTLASVSNTVARPPSCSGWIEEGHYDRVAARRIHPPRTRGGAAARSTGTSTTPRDPLHEGSEEAVVNDVVDTAKRAAQAFTDAFNKKEVKVLVVGGGGREHALCWALEGANTRPGRGAVSRLPGQPPARRSSAPNLAIFPTSRRRRPRRGGPRAQEYSISPSWAPEAPLRRRASPTTCAGAGHAVFRTPARAAARASSRSKASREGT